MPVTIPPLLREAVSLFGATPRGSKLLSPIYRRWTQGVHQALKGSPIIESVRIRGSALAQCHPGISDIDVDLVIRDGVSPQSLENLLAKLRRVRSVTLPLGEITVCTQSGWKLFWKIASPTTVWHGRWKTFQDKSWKSKKQTLKTLAPDGKYSLAFYHYIRANLLEGQYRRTGHRYHHTLAKHELAKIQLSHGETTQTIEDALQRLDSLASQLLSSTFPRWDWQFSERKTLPTASHSELASEGIERRLRKRGLKIEPSAHPFQYVAPLDQCLSTLPLLAQIEKKFPIVFLSPAMAHWLPSTLGHWFALSLRLPSPQERSHFSTQSGFLYRRSVIHRLSTDLLTVLGETRPSLKASLKRAAGECVFLIQNEIGSVPQTQTRRKYPLMSDLAEGKDIAFSPTEKTQLYAELSEVLLLELSEWHDPSQTEKSIFQ